MIKTILGILLTIAVLLFLNTPKFTSETQTVELRKSINNVGIAPYAIQKPDFPCRAYLNSLKGVENIYVAFLHNTFGNDNRCIKKVLRDERLRLVEIHLFNEVCVRNGNCGKYEALAGIHKRDLNSRLLKIHKNRRLKRKILKQARRAKKLLDENLVEGAQCFISPLLESEYVKPKAASKLFKLLKPIFPNCGFVWNPMVPKFMISEADIFESPHGPNAFKGPNKIANLDGDDIDFYHRRSFFDAEDRISEKHIPSYIKNHRTNLVTFLWSAECNCIGRSWKDPRQRVCKANGVYKRMGYYVRKAQ